MRIVVPGEDGHACDAKQGGPRRGKTHLLNLRQELKCGGRAGDLFTFTLFSLLDWWKGWKEWRSGKVEVDSSQESLSN